MHQRRTERQGTVARRMVGGLAVASITAFVGGVVLAATCFPLCHLYTPDNPEWFLFACMFC